MKRGPKPPQPTEQYELPRDLHHQMVGLFERRGMPVFQDMTRFDRPLKLTLMAIYLQGLEDGYATASNGA